MHKCFLKPFLFDKIKSQIGSLGECTCALVEASLNVSRLVLETRKSGLETQEKKDGTPVSNADKLAQDIILEKISTLGEKFSHVGIVSEELPPLPPAFQYGDFWLIDPLDGTKGFIIGKKEFCTNIALLKDGKPILGVVAVPAFSSIYFASQGKGAWKINAQTSSLKQIHCQKLTRDSLSEKGLRILSSSRHNSRRNLKQHLQKNRNNPKIAFIHEIGSAVKILKIAEGHADYYYQPGATMAWDIAAPQIILEEAGGAIRTLDGQCLSYGKNNWKNTIFEVLGTSEKIFD
ncbi:3'(2'),5'-bisphosphate nucleotidase CysQ [Acetobacteraceae bacterium]|nr:3'(2'),5'-bisphosphate nucleotidase CysQ [Acetobacteraceae bacterium]